MWALSVKQPWADLIVYGIKNVENRSWPLPRKVQGRRVVIHAGVRTDRAAAAELLWAGSPEWDGIVRRSLGRTGGLVGSATFSHCIGGGDHSAKYPWYEGPFGFVVACPTAYESVVPFKGRLGFFWLDHDSDYLPK